LQLVNSALSSLPTFFMCTIKVQISILNQIDKYNRHCLWRGGDINGNKAPLVAWKLVTRPKRKGGLGLGVIRMRLQNEALLLKNLHKFYSKADLTWVKLIWNKYYNNGRLPGQIMKGSFWWRSLLKLITTYKGIAQANLQSCRTIIFWSDMWNGRILQILYPHLYSFSKNSKVSVRYVLELERLQDQFHLPLSEEAYQEYYELEVMMQLVQYTEEHDYWSYIWGNGNYSSSKAYNHLLGTEQVHPALKWIWRTSCQQNHKVLFWLLLQDRLNIRGLLKRKNMQLESYTCELCLLQREEKLRHLFFRCSFAKNCWLSIGVQVPTWLRLKGAITRIKRNMKVPFTMEVIIIMFWSIWIERNTWIFQDEDPSIDKCKATF
jgi:hypothetical protein